MSRSRNGPIGWPSARARRLSIDSLVPSPSSRARMQSFSHGIRKRLTMKPGPVLGDDGGLAEELEELDGGLVRPRRRCAARRRPRPASSAAPGCSSGCRPPAPAGGSRRRCRSPRASRCWCGRAWTRDDDVVQLAEEVLLQSPRSSKTASMTMSQGARSSSSVVPPATCLAASAAEASSLPSLTALVEEAVDVRRCPRLRLASSMSNSRIPVPAPGRHGGDPGTHGSRAEDADDLLVVAHPSLPLARGRGTAGPRGRADLDVKVRRPPYARWSRCPPPRSQRLLRARGRAADQQSLDLIGPVVDLRDLRVPRHRSTPRALRSPRGRGSAPLRRTPGTRGRCRPAS